ncbi:MAG: PAS domain-containing protein [Deltaproteobacteria bacterium]|nr:PAS domain-containing protein [Deltaproteobacteria bacterium]
MGNDDHPGVTPAHASLQQSWEERVHQLSEVPAGLRQVEEALREGWELWQAMADQLPDFITFKDTEGRFQFMNRCFERWVCLKRGEVIGKTVYDIFPCPRL